MRKGLMLRSMLGLLLTGTATTALLARDAAPAPASAAQSSAAAQLRQLFIDSDEASLRQNPMEALYRGDMRYADQLGDLYSDAWEAERLQTVKDELKRLAAINRSALNPTDQIAYDVFKWQHEMEARGLEGDVLATSRGLPLDHFRGLHLFYPDLASGSGVAPFKTVADYENNLKRHSQYGQIVDRVIDRFRKGAAAGVVQPRLVVRNMIEQLDLQLAQGVEGSIYYGPVKSFPDTIPEADRKRLRDAHARAIRDELLPANRRLRDFLANEYLPLAREGVGLVHMRGGEKYYAHEIEQMTTLPLSAEEVHSLGLAEVARIKGEMTDVMKATGFKGTLPEFFEYLRTDPKFKFSSREQMGDTFREVGSRVDQRVDTLFARRPKAPLEIRPVPEYREKTDAGGSYQTGTADGSRPGVFYYNAYDLPSRSTFDTETLYLHEAVPGHHFQLSLAQENEALPNFLRFGNITAFIEGWGLYAETLWPELGVETDPYQRFGGLNDEMLRAMRLVVDTGLHAKGWSRDQAIQYMLDNSGMSATDARSEVERYIAMPGQALAYKLGQLTISRLRGEAEQALGDRFDIRAFHEQVLNTGALPMGVLESKIRGWIKQQQQQQPVRR